MSPETLLGIWAGVATGLCAGLALALSNLVNERNAYRRKLEMSDPPRTSPPPRPFSIERKAGS